jgi:hypothetical protein
MEARLNLSFEFLLPKQDNIPDWIVASDEPFFAFAAGYIDAERVHQTCVPAGYSTPQGRLEIRSCDRHLLTQLGEGFNSRGIPCPPAALRVRAGYTNRYGVRSSGDL